ncbi:hypothetical protein B0T09DRAFT_317811 [Sordaria sp. MPI-SDFR-AT-0083]|nr:hypothetical protein B0T09DRAFT_317811 [Sordaria sp. MPI-SDFR-AT-0083]
MASPRATSIDSVENTTDKILTLWQPVSFDIVMTRNDDIAAGPILVNNPPLWLIAMHDQIARAHHQIREIALSVGQEQAQGLATLRTQYEDLRDNYNLVATMFKRGLEASQNQVAKFEQGIQQASDRFASEVWTVIAKYGKQDAARQKAIDQLREISLRHQKALETLNERTARQQFPLGHAENRATTHNQQISDIYDKLVHPSQLKALEEQITNLQRTIEQAGQKAPDTASILRLLEQRAAIKAPSTTQHSSLSEPFFGFLKDNDLQAAQARRQANQARMQREATYANNYGTGSVRFGQSAGRQGSPGPPRPPRNTLGPAGNDDDDARNQANSFLANWGYPTIQTTPIHLNKPATYDGKKLDAFRPWWARISAYLHAYAASFPTDSHKINWLGSMLTDKAQKWHDSRSRQIRSMGVEDTWKGDREEEGAEDLANSDEAQFKKAKTNAITRAMQTMEEDSDSDSDF